MGDGIGDTEEVPAAAQCRRVAGAGSATGNGQFAGNVHFNTFDALANYRW